MSVQVPGTPDDRQLARRLAREAQAAGKAQARAARAHARALDRRERALRAARRGLPAGTVVAAGSASAAVLTGVPWWLVLTAAASARAAAALRTLRRPPPVPPLPAGSSLPPPPDPRSAAWPAVRRLEQARDALTRLLPMVSPAGREAAVEAWHAAAEADLALRWQAARIAAVEPHRSMAGDPLLAQLAAGVAAQEQLVQAVADLVTACADPPSTGRLQDATDRLHGLAQGLREVR
jgi:hypothetical protein